jgi:hypothetical protein
VCVGRGGVGGGAPTRPTMATDQKR